MAKKELNALAIASILMTAVLAGCNKEEPTATPPAKTDTTPSVSPTTKPATTIPAAVSTAVDSAKETVNAAKETAVKDATAKLDEITGLIKDKKFDMADSGLKKLEDNKATLPEAVQTKLPEIRKALDAAKMMNTAVKAPEVPKTAVPDLSKTPEVPGLNK